MYIYLTDFSWLTGEYEKKGDGTKHYRRMAELKSVELVFERAKSDLGLKENCKIVRDEKGKPHIEGAELYISISHNQILFCQSAAFRSFILVYQSYQIF